MQSSRAFRNGVVQGHDPNAYNSHILPRHAISPQDKGASRPARRLETPLWVKHVMIHSLKSWGLSETCARILCEICFPASRGERLVLLRLSLALCLHHDASRAESLATCQIRVSQGGTQPEDWDPQLGRLTTPRVLLTPCWSEARLGHLGSWPQPAGKQCTSR